MAQTVSKKQLVQLLRQAGFPEKDIPTMVGIAGGESSYNPQAYNPNANTGDKSYGLFQINMLGAMGPERRRQFGLESNDQLFDPATNVKAAKQIYDTQGLGAWSVYNNKSYQNFLPTSAEVEPGEPVRIPVQYPADYPTGDIPTGDIIVNNNYYGPQDSEFNKEDMTKDMMQSLLLQSLLQKSNKGLSAPSLSEIMQQEMYGGGYLNPTLYMQNQGIGLY